MSKLFLQEYPKQEFTIAITYKNGISSREEVPFLPVGVGGFEPRTSPTRTMRSIVGYLKTITPYNKSHLMGICSSSGKEN